LWNLAQFASCLLPLMGGRAAVEPATEAIHRFTPTFDAARLARFRAKIGLLREDAGDGALIERLLALMADQGADFTRVFAGLADGTAAAEFRDPAGFEAWARDWRARCAQEADPVAVMARANPRYIARNHRVEAAIGAAVAGDLAPFQRLNAILARPFDEQPGALADQAAPRPDQAVRQTFCGT
jgi:uncharacterized protein YdiU (UPF0061 family)